ncbi:MAG: SsrA-binding protein SmpB [Elusimicrobiota bacterium]|mgnify:CR=1 FL=1
MKSSHPKLLAENRKARFRFEIIETLEAGLSLSGSEAKSAKTGGMNLGDAYAIVKNRECWLLNCHISPYAYDSMAHMKEPMRSRKLLLKRSEIDRVMGKLKAKGLTLVALDAHISEKGWIKMTLGLAKGKNAPDRKEDIKKRDIERELGGRYKLR